MPRFLADHNFKDTILDGLRRRGIELEVTLSRAIGLDRVADPALLSIAAELDLIVLTHDRKTMTRDANLRVARGDDMPASSSFPGSCHSAPRSKNCVSSSPVPPTISGETASTSSRSNPTTPTPAKLLHHTPRRTARP